MNVHLGRFYAANDFFFSIYNFAGPAISKTLPISPDSTIQFPQFQSTFISSDFDEIWNEGSSIVGLVAANEFFFFSEILNFGVPGNLKLPTFCDP